MLTNLTLNLNISFFNEDSMLLEIKTDSNDLLFNSTFKNNKYSIEFEVELPTKLILTLSKRNPGDTEIDANGNLVQDKNIHLHSIKIFDTEIESYKLTDSIISYKDLDGNPVSPTWFWNKNGTVVIDFDDPDPLCWLLRHQEIW